MMWRLYHIYPHCLVNGTTFRKKCIEHKKFFSFFQQLVWNISRSEKNWDIIINVHSLHVKYPLFLSDFNETWIFSHRFSKNTQIYNVIKMRSVRAEFLHAGGRIVAFRNFANAPTKRTYKSVEHYWRSLPLKYWEMNQKWLVDGLGRSAKCCPAYSQCTQSTKSTLRGLSTSRSWLLKNFFTDMASINVSSA